MSSLLDIASSGIQAYRKALAVTGQNIANINTEGYRRREISLSEVSGGSSDITTISDQTGLGVQVTDIARAFDEFLASRTRGATADFGEAEASQVSLEALEKTILPSDYDLTYFLTEFFDGLSSIAQAPADLSGRVVAMSQGEALAGAFGQTASALSSLKDQILAQAKITVTEVNSLLSGLQNTQRQVIATSAGSGANAILDSRDNTLSNLSQYIGTTLETMSNGAVKLRLGASGNGPILGTVTDVGSLAVQEGDGRLIVLAGQNQGLSETQEVTSGRLAGLMSAYETVSSTLDKLDALAKQLATDFNRVHAQGLSLDGSAGGMMFSADAWSIARPQTNLGDFSTSVSADQVIPSGSQPASFIYDSKTANWIGTLADGSLVKSPKAKIVLEGVTVTIIGQPANGDSFILAPSVGKAENMRFLLKRPEELAAAAMVMASADAGNMGSAEVTLVGSGKIDPANLPLLSDVTGNDVSGLAGARLRENGAIGLIPAGTASVDLVSLTRQEQIGFTLTTEQSRTAAGLSLTLADGPYAGSHSFSWPNNSPLAGDAGTTEQIAKALNTGALTDANGLSLADLGLYAAGAGTNLTLASQTASLGAGSLGGVTGTVTPRISSASDIQVFTREGVQIAGTALSQADVIRYLTAANGFLPDAEYRADYLNTSYRGMTVDRASASGSASLTLGGAGFAPYQQAGSSLAARSSEGGSLVLTLAGETSPIALPQGAMAGYIASLINKQSADTGIHADASTKLAFSEVPDGVISFQIIGANSTAITISAGVSNGSLTELARALNAQSSATGFSASLSNDGKRLALSSTLGDDLALTSVTSSGGAFKIGAVDASGAFYGTAETLGGAAGNSSLRLGGMVTLTSALDFSASFNGGAAMASQPDAFVQGLMQRSLDPAGSWQEIDFKLTEGLDSNEAGAEGLLASVGATTLSLSIGGETVSLKANSLTDLLPSTVASAMAQSLRAKGAVPALTGVALASLPTEGTRISVMLGRETYQLEMVGGEISVTGPEADRVTAYFDPSNRLRLAASDGTLSGQALTLSPDTPSALAAAFGLTSAAARQITGRAFTPPLADASFTLALDYAGAVSTATISYDLATQTFSATGLPSGVSFAVVKNANAAPQIQLSTAGNDQNSLRFLAGDDAKTLGLFTAGAQVTLTERGLRFDAVDGAALQVSGSSLAQTGDRLRLSSIPNEDLIVLVTGNGGRIIASALSPPQPQQSAEIPSLSLRVMDAASGRIEIIDQASGSSIAMRYLGADGLISAAGYTFRLNGALANGDQFTVTANLKGTGDASNILALMALESKDAGTGVGGFRESFGAIVTEVGAKTRATKVNASEAMARRDAAAEQDAEYSGVNLDTEAARMLEQQQAYQALARVLRTSTELLQSLLDALR